MISCISQNKVKFSPIEHSSGRSILKGGLVVDPKNHIEAIKDIAFINKHIFSISDKIYAYNFVLN